MKYKFILAHFLCGCVFVHACACTHVCVCMCALALFVSVHLSLPPKTRWLSWWSACLTWCKASALTGLAGGHVPEWQSGSRLLKASFSTSAPPHPPFTPPLPSLFISTHCVPLFYNVFIKLPSGLTWKGRTNKCHTWWNTPLFSWCVPHYTQIIFTGRLWALENWASQLLLFTMLWNVLIHSGNLLQWKRASGAERQQFTAALCVCVFTTACFFSASLLSYYWSIRPHQNQ